MQINVLFCVKLIYSFVHSLQDHQVVWVWFEAGAGRWSCYTPDLTSIIENAYQNGDPFAKYVFLMANT